MPYDVCRCSFSYHVQKNERELIYEFLSIIERNESCLKRKRWKRSLSLQKGTRKISSFCADYIARLLMLEFFINGGKTLLLLIAQLSDEWRRCKSRGKNRCHSCWTCSIRSFVDWFHGLNSHNENFKQKSKGQMMKSAGDQCTQFLNGKCILNLNSYSIYRPNEKLSTQLSSSVRTREYFFFV